MKALASSTALRRAPRQIGKITRNLSKPGSQHVGRFQQALSRVASPVTINMTRQMHTQRSRMVSLQKMVSRQGQFIRTHQLKVERKNIDTTMRAQMTFSSGRQAASWLNSSGLMKLKSNTKMSAFALPTRQPARSLLTAARPASALTHKPTRHIVPTITRRMPAMPRAALSVVTSAVSRPLSTMLSRPSQSILAQPALQGFQKASVTHRQNFEMRKLTTSRGFVHTESTTTRHNPKLAASGFSAAPVRAFSGVPALKKLFAKNFTPRPRLASATPASASFGLKNPFTGARAFCSNGPVLEGSQTHQNLCDAFAGESCANRRYLFFASKADIEGHPEVASLFRATAEGETGHANGHLFFLEEVGDPATNLPIGNSLQNLKSAVAGETHEYTDMYPAMAKTAREEGFDEIADWFETLAMAEKSHAGKFQRALNQLESEQ